MTDWLDAQEILSRRRENHEFAQFIRSRHGQFGAAFGPGDDGASPPTGMARTIGGELGVDWGLLAAIITLFLIPVFAVTYLLQNHLLRGVTFGTIKK